MFGAVGLGKYTHVTFPGFSFQFNRDIWLLFLSQFSNAHIHKAGLCMFFLGHGLCCIWRWMDKSLSSLLKEAPISS